MSRSYVGAVLVAAFALLLGFSMVSCGDKP